MSNEKELTGWEKHHRKWLVQILIDYLEMREINLIYGGCTFNEEFFEKMGRNILDAYKEFGFSIEEYGAAAEKRVKDKMSCWAANRAEQLLVMLDDSQKA